jgi:hypothetical protein
MEGNSVKQYSPHLSTSGSAGGYISSDARASEQGNALQKVLECQVGSKEN